MDFVSFEIAKKLKEKGFREKCLVYYDVEDNVGLLFNTLYTDEVTPCQYTDLLQCHNTGEAESQIDDSDFCIDAPTISQVLYWLRKEKKLHIAIDIWERTWGYNLIDLRNGRSLHWTAYREDIKSYEDAALDGIKYIMDVLI